MSRHILYTLTMTEGKGSGSASLEYVASATVPYLQATSLPPSVIASAMAVDNLMMAPMLALLMAVPVPAPSPTPTPTPTTATATSPPTTTCHAALSSEVAPPPLPLTADRLALSLAAAALACAFSQHVATLLHCRSLHLLILAAVAAAMSCGATRLLDVVDSLRGQAGGQRPLGATPFAGGWVGGWCVVRACVLTWVGAWVSC